MKPTNVSLTPTGLERLCNMYVRDANEHSFPERYALLYAHLLTDQSYNVLSKFKISELKQAMRSLDKKEKSHIEKYFGLTGGTIHYTRVETSKDVALRTMRENAEKACNKLRSLRALYLFSEPVKMAVDAIAKKVWDPSDSDNITKTGYACLYYLFLKNYNRFYFEKKPSKPFSNEVLDSEKINYLLPFFVIEAYKRFFSKLQDGELLVPMIDIFFETFFKDVKESVYQYAQITQSVYIPVSVCEMRNIKEQMFPKGPWNTQIDFFLLSSIKSASVTELRNGLRAKKHFAKTRIDPVEIQRLPYSDMVREFPVFEYVKGFKTADTNQLIAYHLLCTFLTENMPDLPLGKKKIPFKNSSLIKEIDM